MYAMHSLTYQYNQYPPVHHFSRTLPYFFPFSNSCYMEMDKKPQEYPKNGVSWR